MARESKEKGGTLSVPSTVEPFDFSKISHGSVTEDDWLGICRSLFRVKGTERHAYLEVGVLSAKTSRGLIDVMSQLGFEGILYSVDKAKSAETAWKSRAYNTGYLEPRFLLGVSWEEIPKIKEPIVWAFIDACHCEGCVLKDIDAIVPKMPIGGTLVFHDADDQRERGMLVHEKYHGDGIKRPYGVSSAIMNSPQMNSFNRIDKVKANLRKQPAPTPIFGGLQVWQKYE